MFFLSFLCVLLCSNLLILRSTFRTKSGRSLSAIVFICFFFVLIYEIYREISGLLTGHFQPYSLGRVRVLLVEYFLYGYFFKEVVDHVTRFLSKTR